MNKICTSIEQAQRLIELGIDVNTADMFYAEISIGGNIKHNLFPLESYGFKTFIDAKLTESKSLGFIPAWSLSALMNLLDDKAGLAKEYGLWYCYDNGKSHCTKHCETQIDAAFEMVCWLLENKKI